MAKRMISLLLALIMTLALAVPALASEGTDPAAEKPQESQTEPQETADDPAEGPVEAEDTAPQGPIEGALAETVAEEPAPEEEEEQADAVYAPAPVSADNGIMLASSALMETLEGLITKAKGIKEEGDYAEAYIDASREALEKALKTAQDLKEAGSDDNDAILRAVGSLSLAIDGMDKNATEAEKSALKTLVDKADALIKSEGYTDMYTETTRTELGSKKTAADTALKAEPPQHKDVVAATKPLQDALDGMKGTAVTAKVLASGYYAKEAQAESALKKLDDQVDTSGLKDDTVYVNISAPKTEEDMHKYRLKVEAKGKSFTEESDLDFSGRENKVFFYTPDTLKEKLKLEGDKLEFADKDTVRFTLLSYYGTYNGETTKLKEETSVTVTIDRSYEGPRIVESGYRLKAEDMVPDQKGDGSHDVMYVVLDSEISTNKGNGYALKLTDPSGKTMTVNSGTLVEGEKFVWSWGSASGSILAAPEGMELAAGRYTVGLYAVEKGDYTKMKQVDSAVIQVPAADLTELNKAIAAAEEKPLDANKWVTKDKVEEAQGKLKTARELAGKNLPNSTDNNTTIKSAADELNTALNALKEKLDCSELQKAIDEAKAINPKWKEDTNYDALKSAITEAESFINGEPDKDRSGELTTKKTAIETAVKDLAEKNANTTAFDTQYSAAEEELEKEAQYTKASWAAFKEMYTAAKTQVADKKAELKADKQALIDGITEELKKAIEGLTKAADLTELKAALAEAKKLKASDYIDFSAMKKAISDAETFINSDPDVSQNDKAATLKDALDKAKAGLAALKYKDQVTGNGGWKKEEGVWRYYQKGSAQPLKDSWLKSGGKWYFLAAGTGNMVTGWQFIDGQYYHFAKSGVMEKLSGWKKINGGWYWFTKNDMRAGSWLKTGGKWYYLGDNGRMLTGLQVIDGKTYYLKSSGAMATGWKKIDGKWYRFGSSGAMLKAQWAKVSGKWYYLDANGVMLTGKQVIGGKTYYLKSSGAMLTGWKKISGHWEYYDKSGIMVKSKWVKSSGKWYYLNADGVMLTGLQEIEGKTYYLKSSGAMLTGWKKIDGKWYRFNSSGAMVKSKWAKVSGKWYYMNASGVMLTGLQAIDGETYYLKSSGAMATGWKKISGKWYWFSSSGIMAKSKWVKSSGKWYYLDADGVMLTGWLEQDGKKYYLDSSGVMVTGSRIIDRKVYLFNSKGEMLKNGWQKVGMLKYYLREDGSAYADEWLKISGKWYYFLGDGSMAMNMWIDKKYWVGADGVWVK